MYESVEKACDVNKPNAMRESEACRRRLRTGYVLPDCQEFGKEGENVLHRKNERHRQEEISAERTAELRRRLDAAVSHLCSLNLEEAEAMRDVNLFRWLCSMVRLSGSQLTKMQIGAMLDGDTVDEATIEEYRYLRACTELYLEFRHMVSLDMCLDEKYIRRFNSILSGDEFFEYRRGNPVLREMSYNPPHSCDIKELMRDADREIASAEHGADPVEGAVRTHDMIMAIWPFEEKNAETAYAAMSYELFYAGYPLPTLDITEAEHFQLTADFIQKGSSLRFRTEVIENLLDQCGDIQLGL